MSSPIAEIWCQTQNTIVKINYEWTINNFSLAGHVVRSSIFSSDADGSTKWCLKAYPTGYERGEDGEGSGFLSLYLILVSRRHKADVIAKFRCLIVNANRDKLVLSKAEVCRFSKGSNWGFKKFISRDYLFHEAHGLLPDDKLTILCEICVVVDSFNIAGQTNMVQFKVPACKLSDDLGNLLDNEWLCDVTFMVSGRKLEAHKAILSARSAVFAAMFKHDMEENKQNQVTINDIDYEVLVEMLRFIYTGKSPNLVQMPHALLVAADKYALDKLKVMCEEALFGRMSVETATGILILADLHSAEQLKVQTIDFINAHATEVMDTIDWKDMIVSHPHLIDETYRTIAKQEISSIGPPQKRVKMS